MLNKFFLVRAASAVLLLVIVGVAAFLNGASLFWAFMPAVLVTAIYIFIFAAINYKP